MPPGDRRALGILTHRDIFMAVDYRTVFVRGDEVILSKSEFEILQLFCRKSAEYSHTSRFIYAPTVTTFLLR